MYAYKSNTVYVYKDIVEEICPCQEIGKLVKLGWASMEDVTLTAFLDFDINHAINHIGPILAHYTIFSWALGKAWRRCVRTRCRVTDPMSWVAWLSPGSKPESGDQCWWVGGEDGELLHGSPHINKRASGHRSPLFRDGVLLDGIHYAVMTIIFRTHRFSGMVKVVIYVLLGPFQPANTWKCMTISIRSADKVFIVLCRFHTKYVFCSANNSSN